MTDIKLLLEGYQRFHENNFQENKDTFQDLAKLGQFPKTLMIACSDSRVDPSIITDSKPGEIFVIRNVANLVPPCEESNEGYHGTSAALEFAVKNLNVENIIVMGHSGCAGIEALINLDIGKNKDSFIDKWVRIAHKAESQSRLLAQSKEETCKICEKESIIVSLENIITFPWIKEKVDSGDLKLFGWHFTINDGSLRVYDFNNGGEWAEVTRGKK